ncbi:MAG: hypothetical protein ACKOE6_08510 [Flammeovirgaceae bacterium]
MRRLKARKVLSDRYGIDGIISETSLTKPCYAITFEEYANIHSVASILTTANASQAFGQLHRNFHQCILNAMQRNEPDIPIENIEAVYFKFSSPLCKEHAIIRQYLKAINLKYTRCQWVSTAKKLNP